MSVRPADLLASYRCLLSYWYYQGMDLEKYLAQYFPRYRPPIFVDSGAFSAMTQGEPIVLKDYAAWLLKYRHLFEVYANLDVIKHPTQTWANQQRLEGDYGLSPLPVFHTATPFSWLERYLARYPYIALGGMVGHNWTRYMGWLVQCFALGQGRVKFHGFGVTAWQAWKSFPWYSVDSSAWGSATRYGALRLFLPTEGRWVSLSRHDRPKVYQHADQLRRLGLDPGRFLQRDRTSPAPPVVFAAANYLTALHYIQQLHATPQARLYLACSNFLDLGRVAVGLARLADPVPVEALA